VITNPIPVIQNGMARGMPALRAGPPRLDRWHAAGAGSCLVFFFVGDGYLFRFRAPKNSVVQIQATGGLYWGVRAPTPVGKWVQPAAHFSQRMDLAPLPVDLTFLRGSYKGGEGVPASSLFPFGPQGAGRVSNNGCEGAHSFQRRGPPGDRKRP